MKKFEVYTWGTYDLYDENKHAIGHEAPKRMQFLETDSPQFFDPTSISHVEANSEYAVALSEEGAVYSWGTGERGRLGIGSTDSLIYPAKISFGNPNQKENKGKTKKKDTEFELEYEKINDAKKKIQKLGNKDDLLGMHNFIQGFFKKGEHYDRKITFEAPAERRFSEDEYFDIAGFEEEVPLEVINYEQVKLVSKDTLNSNIILASIEKVYVTQVSCSDNHTLVCTNSGSVYGWGSNEYCQLGFDNKDGNKSFVSAPKKIFGSLKRCFIERVAAGHNHSLALSNEGVAHGWGSNFESQLGVSKIDDPLVRRPIQLQCINCYSNSKRNGVRMIRANGNYSLFLTEARKCYVSDPNSTGFVLIHLESGYVSNCFLGPHYAIIIDTNRSIHFCSLSDQNAKFHE